MKHSLRATSALLLFLSLFGGFASTVSAAPAKGAAKPVAKTAKPGVKGKKPMAQRMFEAVGFTPDQKKKTQVIQKAQRAQVGKIKADKKLSEADKKTKVKAARKAGDDKINALLTAAQKPKMAAFRKQIIAENKAKAAKM